MDICLWQLGVQPELPTFILGFLTFFFLFCFPMLWVRAGTKRAYISGKRKATPSKGELI